MGGVGWGEQTTPSVGEDMELELLSVAGENEKCAATLDNPG